MNLATSEAYLVRHERERKTKERREGGRIRGEKTGGRRNIRLPPLKAHSSQHVFRAFPQCLYGLISDNRRSPQLLSAQEPGHRDEKRPPDSRHHRGLS